MSNEATFQVHLDSVRRDLGTAIKLHDFRLVLSEILLGSSDGRALMQRNIELWAYILHSLLISFHITLGRVMDRRKAVQSFPRLLELCNSYRGVFSKESFEARAAKRLQGQNLEAYVARMFEPSATDLKRLASRYGELRSKYEAIAPVRNKIAAHNVAASAEEITSLLKDAQLEVLDFVTYGLKGIVDDIHELYHNGTRPALEPAKTTRREELLKSVRLALLPPSD